MAYSTLADILAMVQEDTLRQMTDDDMNGVVDTAKVDAAILTADEIINGFLRGRYTVPLTTVPPLVMGLSRDLAIYEVYSRRGEGGCPDNVVKRADNVRKMLGQIQRGEMLLDVTLPDVSEIAPLKTNKTDDDRVFTKTFLEGF